MEKSLIIIDGNSLMNRAYYAIQRPMITKDGLYTQGIFGFLNMLNKILNDYNPTHISVAFDRKAPTFRHLEYAEYKAGRHKMPVELAMEFPVVKDVLQAMNIHMLEIDGFEADDILGTVSRVAEEEDFTVRIITGDKDAFQLASKKTTIIYTKRGTSEFDAYDEQAVFDRYGFSPQQFIDFKGLMGDSSDNIPGLPGVGEKTATKLILEYRNVENLIASLDSMSNSKLKTKIEENAQLAVMSKRLATINRFVPLDINFEDMKYEEPDYDQLIELYKKLEFNSFLKKLANKSVNQAMGTAIPTGTVIPQNTAGSGEISSEPLDEDIFTVAEECEIVHVSDAEGVSNISGEITDKKCIWLKVFHDDNHRALPAISSICIAVPEKIFVIHCDFNYSEVISELFNSFSGKICGHDLKKDYYALISNGNLKARESTDTVFNTLYDTALAAYLIDPQKKSYDLSVLMLETFHVDFPDNKKINEDTGTIDLFGNSFDIQADYARRIFAAASSLLAVQSSTLRQYELIKVFQEVELPLVEVLAAMEYYGIRTDADELNKIGQMLKERTSELTKMIYAMAGEEFNINSPKQLGVILFEKMNLPNGKKTKTGYSTNAEILEKLVDESPIIPLILEYRMLVKLIGTYIDGMLPLIDSSGKIHAHFQQTVTATGRLSCTEPNLQNIPIRQELGRTLRRVFEASSDKHILVGADYSQVELRIMAHFSEDPALLQSFQEGNDIHTMTASRVFDVPIDEVTSLQRSRAKAVNFGVIYGISSFGLSGDLNISRKEAQSYIDEYFKKHPKVRDYMNDCVEFCKEHNYVTTLLGRRRFINEIHASNFMTRQLGERLAMNTPVQGTAADIMKIAMIKVYKLLNRECPVSHLILQVHDELIIDADINEEEKVKELLEDSMKNAVLLKVPLTAEVKSAENWYDLK